MKKWILLICVIFTVTFVLVTKIGNIFTPITAPIQQLVEPKPAEVLPDPVVIVHEVNSLSRLETATITVERVLRAERDNERLWGAFGEKMLFVAYGQAIVGVDLSLLQENDLVVIDSKTVEIHLPSAEIFNVVLDNEKSYVYDRDKGILADSDPQLETLVRKRAEIEIRNSALAMGILEMADKNAEYDIKNFLQELGFINVIFTDLSPEAISPE